MKMPWFSILGSIGYFVGYDSTMKLPWFPIMSSIAEVAQKIERDREHISIIICKAPRPWAGRVAVMKFKTMKIDSEGFLWFSTKNSTPESYRPYGI
jgi:hypothetical protein